MIVLQEMVIVVLRKEVMFVPRRGYICAPGRGYGCAPKRDKVLLKRRLGCAPEIGNRVCAQEEVMVHSSRERSAIIFLPVYHICTQK
jgi:hypothetical protein